MIKLLDAGVDQFGGEADPALLVSLVAAGSVSEARLDVSVRRVLREKFELGLFDQRFVDVDAADAIVGAPEFRAAGEHAQRASITVLTNRDEVLPLRSGTKLYLEGIDPDVARAFGTVVDSPDDADVAIIRLQAPYDIRETAFENHFHAGLLEFPAEVIARVRELQSRVPTIVDVYLDRPAILEPLVSVASAVTANWGSHASALLDVLTGRAPSTGKLPFDLPRSVAAVAASRPDVPFDTADPLFRFGHGLSL